MKRVMYTCIALMLVISSLFGQGNVEESTMNMSLGEQNGFLISIPEVEKGFVEDVWDDYMKERGYGKTKRNKKADEYYGDEVSVPVISGGEKFSMYAKFSEGADMTAVKVWVDKGGYFVNSAEHSDEAAGVEKFLQEFRTMVKREHLEDMMDDQRKVVKKEEKYLGKLEKKNTNLHKDIEKLKKKIEQKEADIEKNLQEQEDQKMKILSEKKNLEKIQEKINNIVKE